MWYSSVRGTRGTVHTHVCVHVCVPGYVMCTLPVPRITSTSTSIKNNYLKKCTCVMKV